jgi:DNA-binding transcriptional LysR family regulator
MLDPKRILTFRAVARERSFSRAARTLALSQPAVSTQVGSLERELGVRLLDRRPGGLTLTAAGEILLEHADVIAERLRLADAQLGAAAEAERTRLRIGAFPTAMAGLIPAAIEALRESRPDTELILEEAASDELPARVSSGRLDLAICFQATSEDAEETPGLERRHLLRERFMVALAPDHPLAGRDTVRLAQLSKEDWIAASTDGIIVSACRAAGFEPNLVSITRDQLAIGALVSRGIAVTLVPGLLADAFTGLAVRPISGAAPSRDVYSVLPPGGRHPLVEPTLEALDAIAEQRRAKRTRSRTRIPRRRRGAPP